MSQSTKDDPTITMANPFSISLIWLSHFDKYNVTLIMIVALILILVILNRIFLISS